MTRAGEAKEKSEKSQIVENAKIDVLAEITDNNGKGLSKKQLKDVLKRYFNEEEVKNIEIPDDVSTANNELTSKDGVYKIRLSEIYSGKVENRWEYDHSMQTVENGSLTLKIGDYVNITPYTVDGKQFNGKWRVLGEENGQLLIVSANYVDFEGSINAGGTPVMPLRNTDKIDDVITKLNNIGEKFADGTKTENGRSLTIEDINRITGYDPTDCRLDPSDLTKRGVYGKDNIYQYGNNVTYTIKDDGKVWYKGDKAITDEQKSDYSKFWLPHTSNNITKPFTIKTTGYQYYPETLGYFSGSLVQEGQTLEGISKSSPAYDMLFKSQSRWSYLLSSSCIWTYAGEVWWDMFVVESTGWVLGRGVWSSSASLGVNLYGVRTVVSLKSTIIPNFVSKDDSTGISTYEI